MSQYQSKPKSKTVTDSDRHRPNLFTHEKTIKETTSRMETAEEQLQRQETEIQQLTQQLRRMHNRMSRLEDLSRRRLSDGK